jgi:hypothetical protein
MIKDTRKAAVQARLFRIADELDLPLLFPRTLADVATEIRYLAGLMDRRKSVKHAPKSSRKMTPELKEQLKRDREQHPDHTYERIAQRHGVNSGRVSEAVTGKRT